MTTSMVLENNPHLKSNFDGQPMLKTFTVP